MARYSDAFKASALAALDAAGGDVSKAARELGIPRKTLEEWAKGRVHEDVANLRQGKKADLAALLEDIAYTCVGLLPDKLKAASAAQVGTVMGIAVEKMQLLKGRPTAINQNEYADLSPAEVEQELAGLTLAAAAREGAEAAGGAEVPVVH